MSLLQKAKMMPSRKAAGIHAHDKWGFLYITPFFTIFLLFGLLPILFTVYLAFYHWELLSEANYYVGFQNFSELIKDPYFWIAVRNTFSIFFISFVPQTIVALLLAVVLANPHLKFAMFWRTMLLIPWITSVLAVGIVFSQLLRPYKWDNSAKFNCNFCYLIRISGHNYPTDTFSLQGLLYCPGY